MLNIKKIHNIHFVGIKGVGMAALARAMFDMGKTITGSDVEKEFITQKSINEMEVKPIVGFEANNLPDKIDLVIYSAAHNGNNNPQVIEAMKRGISAISYGRALQLAFDNKKIIAVSGTHGKTTITSMLATILHKANLDPSWIIGTGEISDLPASGHYGKGEWAIIEADEYVDEPNGKPKFLHLNPFGLIITSLDYDHPDIFPTHKLFLNAFHKLLKRVNKKGILVAKEDIPYLRKIAKGFKGRIYWVGNKKLYPGIDYLKIPGKHNLLNAAFAGRMAHEIGVDQKIIVNTLKAFNGLQRRLENKGAYKNFILIDDYAHLPQEIKATLNAIKENYPDRIIVTLFQSHTYSRTITLLNEFGESFDSSDYVFVAPIFASAREEKPEKEVNLVLEIKKNHKNVIEVSDKDDFKNKFRQMEKEISQPAILITMGAGDIYSWVDGFGRK